MIDYDLDKIRDRMPAAEVDHSEGLSLPPPDLFDIDAAKEYVKMAKKSKHLKHLDASNQMLKRFGFSDAAISLLKNSVADELRLSKLIKARNQVKYQSVEKLFNRKSVPNSKFGKSIDKGNKALSITSLALNSYGLHQSLEKDEKGDAVKYGVDAFSDGVSLFKHPVALAYSGGYEGMKLVNEMTDNYIPNKIYYGLGLHDIKKSEGTDNEMKKPRGLKDGLLGMKLGNIKNLEAYIARTDKMIQQLEIYCALMKSKLDEKGIKIDLATAIGSKPDTSFISGKMPYDLEKYQDDLLNKAEQVGKYLEALVCYSEKMENLMQKQEVKL